MPGGWGEGGREGLICPPSCSNKRRPPARTAHAGRGRSEGESVPRRARARAHAGASAGSGWAGRGWAGLGGARPGGAEGGATRSLAGGQGGLVAGRSRKGAAGGTALAPARCEEPSRALELQRRSGRVGRGGTRGGCGGLSVSGRFLSSCLNSASSGLQPSGAF